MSWTYTVLEIYSENGWPEKGEPAGWIQEGLVSYCQGDIDIFVGGLPVRWLLWWKIKSWLEQAWRWLSWEWRWTFHRAEIEKRLARFEEAMAEAEENECEYISILPEPS